MARVMIVKKDGTPTPYFWSDREGKDRTQRTVFKKTDKGVTRMTGVHFNAATNRIEKD